MSLCGGAGKPPSAVTQLWQVPGALGEPRHGTCRVCGKNYQINGSGNVYPHGSKPWTRVSTPTRRWCACFQTYQPDRALCDANRCPHPFPSRHPELWIDHVHDAVGGAE